MKLTFILFTFFINFSNPFFIKAEELIDSSNNQIENTYKEESSINKESESNKIHIVQVGDTITSISKFYSIRKEVILKLNDLKDENYIYVGQNLKISASNEKSKNDEDINSYHVIQKGESLIEISTKYGLNFKDLIEINNLKNPDSLEVGSKLFLRKKDINNQKTTNLIKNQVVNQFISVNKKTYGPISTQQSELEKISGRKILKVLNQNDKKLIISINCETKDLDVRVPGRKWRGWMPAKEEFEKNLIKDFC